MPTPRAAIDPNADDFERRFALKLRGLMTERRMSSTQVSRALAAVGVQVGRAGIDRWLRAESGPRFRDLEKIGQALGFEDYRDLLPSPALKKKAR